MIVELSAIRVRGLDDTVRLPVDCLNVVLEE